MNSKKQSDALIVITFDTLTEVIKKMQMNIQKVMDQLEEVNGKFIRLSNHQEDIDNLKYKIGTIQSKITNTDDTIDQYSLKFLEIDTTFLSLINSLKEVNEKKGESDKWIHTLEDKVLFHENSLNNLNRVVDGNAKAFEKEKEHTSPLFTDIVNLDIRAQKTEETIKNIAGMNEENFRRLELMTEFLDTSSKEQGHKVFKKLNDHEIKTNTVINKVNILTENIMKINQGHSNGNNHSNNLDEEEEVDDFFGAKSETMLEEQLEYKTPIKYAKSGNLSKMNEMIITLEEFKLEYSQNREDNEKEIKTLKDQMVLYESNYQKLLEQQEQLMQEKANREYKQLAMAIDPVELQDQKQQLQLQQQQEPVKGKQILDTIRLIATSVDTKASKEDVTNTQKGLSKDLEKVASKLESVVLKFDSKISLLATQFTNGKNIDPDILVEQMNDQIKAVFEASAFEIMQNHIGKIDLTLNDVIRNAIRDTETHTEELNKVFESLVEIRKSLLSKSVEENVINLLCRMDTIEIDHEATRADIECITQKIEGDPKPPIEKEHNSCEGESENNVYQNEGDFNENQSGSNVVNNGFLGEPEKVPSIRESLELLNSKSYLALDKVDKLEKKQVEIHKNILLIIKQDLRNESKRIFDEFKVNLKSSLARIEDQLREKVDKFNLNEFSQKLDSKFNHEIKYKLDKGDLNKNNISIHKKINSLENKISKALVDTLIDLQIEEAPLLVKKNLKQFDRCASCNQVIGNKRNSYNVQYNNNSNSFVGNPTLLPMSSVDINNSLGSNANGIGNQSKRKIRKYGIKERLPDIGPY